MNNTGLAVALFVSLIFIVQTILSMAGSFMDVDMESGDGLDGDSLGDGIEGSPDGVFGVTMNDLLTLKGFLNFMFGFSWSWACFGLSNIFVTLLAVAVGVFCAFILAFLYKKIAAIETETFHENVEQLVSRMGTVYSVFEDGSVLISIFYNGDFKELHAYPENEVAVGDEISVVRIDDGAIIVRKLG